MKDMGGFKKAKISGLYGKTEDCRDSENLDKRNRNLECNFANVKFRKIVKKREKKILTFNYRISIKNRIQRKIKRLRKISFFKRRAKRNRPRYLVLIRETYRNLFLTVIRFPRNVVLHSSVGMVGFSGSKRKSMSSAYAMGKHVSERLKILKFKKIRIIFKSPHSRVLKSCIYGLTKFCTKFVGAIDRIPVPHNGVRLSKKRRV